MNITPLMKLKVVATGSPQDESLPVYGPVADVGLAIIYNNETARRAVATVFEFS